MKFSRKWAMPSKATFSIPPIADLLNRYVKPSDVVVDPFSGDSAIGTLRNDLKHSGVRSEDWLQDIEGEIADVVLFDPPYSPRQISEHYREAGLSVTMQDTQGSLLYRRVRDELDRVLRVDGTAVSFGWNSGGFGKKRGYEIIEIMLVPHGGARNDTIVVVERKNERFRNMKLEGM